MTENIIKLFREKSGELNTIRFIPAIKVKTLHRDIFVSKMFSVSMINTLNSYFVEIEHGISSYSRQVNFNSLDTDIAKAIHSRLITMPKQQLQKAQR
jgi:hypothetical protein